VAPFRTTADGCEAGLAMGLAEEITTALGRFRWINLVAPGSIQALAAEPRGESERWRRLGLDFLLDGAIQLGGAQIRVTVRLVDMRAAGEVVWSGRFDRPASDLLALQDDIAAETVARIDPELLLHESRRLSAWPAGDATAYELMLRAIPAIYRLDEPGYRVAGAWLRDAAALAPDNGSIHAWWACWHAFLVGQGWADDPLESMREASRLADRAVSLDPFCARALSVAGYVRSFILHRSIDETIALHERALALNPNLPFAWAVSALTLSYAGEHLAALERGQQAKRLSPFDPHSFFFDNALMVPLLMLRRFEQTVELGRAAAALNPAMSSTLKGLLSALGHLGRGVEAADVLAQLLRLEPGFTLRRAAERSPLRRVEDLYIYVEGLRRAGLPE
jgi:TolB-like protein